MKIDISNPNTGQVVTDDIIEEEILELFPVKSLVRFKSVSKQWKSMIESSYFAKKRLARFPNPKLVVLRSEISTDRCWSSSDLPVSVGFGRDIVTGKYKVILMYLFDSRTLIKAEVFNLDNGERRYIYFPIFHNELCNDKTSIFANGSLYWLTKPVSVFTSKLTNLGAIDLHTEKFRYVLLPTWYTIYSESAYLWSLRDRLCLSDVPQYSNYVGVWSLQQEKPSVKWEKLLSINISNINCLDVNYWKLGLAAGFLRHGKNKASKEEVMNEHNRTVLYTENLGSSV
ncbi:unnamed protein product [Arabis nemorensis]|uniref:F-box domain-containing protein n=1 Tax=Arabis nemorensis TaxID=586526 RepID=A0A565BZ48_9BRAS|nr:unnamed protein product [Arabis nemorensis]